MRLAQLARKLSLRPAQIVEFLAQRNIQMEESSNARMEDSHVEMIVQHYAPESLSKITNEVEEAEEIVSAESEIAEAPPVIVQQNVTENEEITEPEVIRVQKIELSGLKVLGKIELPEPKKKEVVEEQSSETTPTEAPVSQPAIKPRHTNRKPGQQNRERSQQRSWKNPIELQRERETREAEEKRRTAIEQEKLRRKQHYEQKVKAVAQPKRSKPAITQPEIKRRVDTRPVPKTWFGKFLRWWTT